MKSTIIAYFIYVAYMFMHCAPTYAQWVQTNGPSGGAVTALAVSGTDLFAGCYNSGVFRTTNNGLQWTLASAGLPGSDVQCLAASANTLFTGFYADGIFRSTDEGATWTEANKGLNFFLNMKQPVTALAVIGANVFAGFNEGAIYRSTNEGTLWTLVNYSSAPEGSSQPVTSFASSGSYIFATKFLGGLIRSSDDGATWYPTNNDLIDTAIIALAANANSVFAGDVYRGVFRSTNGGQSWTQSNTGLTDLYIGSLLAQGSDVFAATHHDGVFRSTDDGVTWTHMSNGLSDTTVGDLAAIDSTLFAATESGGVCRSTDRGDTWKEVNHGLVNGSGRLVYVSDTVIIAGIRKGLARSTNNGDEWTKTTYDFIRDPYDVLAFFKKDDLFFVGTKDGILRRSTDLGLTWVVESTTFPKLSSYSVLFLEEDIFVIGINGGFSRSQDNGNTWTSVLDGLPQGGIIGVAISGEHLFVVLSGEGAFHSEDRGTTWKKIITGPVMSIHGISATDNYLFADTYTGLARSSDLGQTWQSANDDLTDLDVSAPGKLGPYLCTISRSRIVYLSTNEGASWTKLDMQDVLSPHSLALNSTYMFAGNSGLGLWRRPLSEVFTSVVDGAVQSTGPSLRVSPNPADASTTISFTLSISGFVTLNIFSTQGECVANILSLHLEAGSNTIDWTAPGVAGGLYFVQLQSGCVMQTQPLVLLR